MEALHIICPRPQRFMAVISALGALAIVMWSLWTGGHALLAIEFGALFTLLVHGLFAVFAVGLLYRNLVYRDQLLIVCASESASAGSAAIVAEDIESVELVPEFSTMSPEGKLEALGLHPGRLRIVTRQGTFLCGAGLDELELSATAGRIEAFRERCGTVPHAG